jgi:hypothetical protein
MEITPFVSMTSGHFVSDFDLTLFGNEDLDHLADSVLEFHHHVSNDRRFSQYILSLVSSERRIFKNDVLEDIGVLIRILHKLHIEIKFFEIDTVDIFSSDLSAGS